MAQQHPFSRSSTGATYPKNYITAIIDSLEEADEAVAALQQAGFSPSDIVLLVDKHALEIIQEYERHNNWLRRMMRVVSAVVSDEGQYYLLYEAAAREGHHLLNVYAPKPEQREKANTVLREHHGHNIKFFGSWSIVDFT